MEGINKDKGSKGKGSSSLAKPETNNPIKEYLQDSDNERIHLKAMTMLAALVIGAVSNYAKGLSQVVQEIENEEINKECDK